MPVLKQDVELTILNCISCGAFISLLECHQHELKRTHTSFYCPNGHAQYYTAASREEILARQLDETRKVLTATEARLSQAETFLAKAKKRTRAGVCLYCQRTFQNVSRHMATKHLDK